MPGTPKHASAATFGHEFVKAYETRGIPRSEIHRVTGIGRTTLDHYRTGRSLPKLEAAAQLAALLDWPRLREIVATARTKACLRCGRAFSNDSGNSGAKKYCSVACHGITIAERLASTRIRQAGQTGDGKRRYQALARLRSGIRIAEGRAAELRDAIAAMCAGCEPEGVCRTADCPLRGFSPLPYSQHVARGTPRNKDQIRSDTWTPARRRAQSEMTVRLHAEGRIPHGKHENHAAHDPARREQWIARIRATKAARRPKARMPISS